MRRNLMGDLPHGFVLTIKIYGSKLILSTQRSGTALELLGSFYYLRVGDVWILAADEIRRPGVQLNTEVSHTNSLKEILSQLKLPESLEFVAQQF